MTRFITSALRRFRDDEAGSMVVPFALWTPIFVGIVLSTIEMGTVTLRHTVLERALDQTVRSVKLSTGRAYSQATLKAKICAQAAALPNCDEGLFVEMVNLDMRDWQTPPQTAECVNTSVQVTPEDAFTHGSEHEMMMLRACYKYKPISPAGYLSSSLAKDENGYTALVSVAVFVSEPL